MHDDFDTSATEIVACSSTMGNLLRFAGSIKGSFNFDVDAIGKTVFFVRKEKSPTELIHGVRGYGHTFPEAYTSWDAASKGSVSHQRMVKYTFGGLKCLVRFESDGHIKDSLSTEERETLGQSKPSRDSLGEEGASGLLAAAGSVAVSEQAPSSGEAMKVERKGVEVPQKAVFDLKTRSFKNVINMDEILRRTWMSQTPNFIVGYHTRGRFQDVQVQDIQSKILQWESDNQILLGRLNATLRRIIEIAQDSDGQRLQVYRVDDGPVKICKHVNEDWRALPADLRARWASEPEIESEMFAIPSPKDSDQGSETQGISSGRTHSVGPDDESDDFGGGYDSDDGGHSSPDSEKDFTACSAEDCGYCGHCGY